MRRAKSIARCNGRQEALPLGALNLDRIEMAAAIPGEESRYADSAESAHAVVEDRQLSGRLSSHFPRQAGRQRCESSRRPGPSSMRRSC